MRAVNAGAEGICAEGAGSTARFVTESQTRLWGLVRRAVSVLERDRSEAWRCLRDAYILFDQRAAAEPGAGNSAPAIRPGCLAAWQARRVVEYIEQHLGAKLTNEDIAAAIGLSKSHFSRAFKSTLGASPMVYVATRRVERAKRMMVASAESLAEVALDCGFADQSHLNRQFRRTVGMSPGQWRRSSVHAPDGVRIEARSQSAPMRRRSVLGQGAIGAAVG
jgi:AraC family transcriptional regulator